MVPYESTWQRGYHDATCKMWHPTQPKLGGFKYGLFSPLLGEMIQFDCQGITQFTEFEISFGNTNFQMEEFYRELKELAKPRGSLCRMKYFIKGASPESQRSPEEQRATAASFRPHKTTVALAVRRAYGTMAHSVRAATRRLDHLKNITGATLNSIEASIPEISWMMTSCALTWLATCRERLFKNGFQWKDRNHSTWMRPPDTSTTMSIWPLMLNPLKSTGNKVVFWRVRVLKCLAKIINVHEMPISARINHYKSKNICQMLSDFPQK